MRIDHFAVYVRDLERTRRFYETYFGVSVNTKYHNPGTGLETYFLTFPDGGRLEIMTRPGLAAGPDAQYAAGYVHLSVAVGGSDAVDALTRRLREDGYTVQSDPRTTGDGYYESCVLDPEGNQVEIVG